MQRSVKVKIKFHDPEHLKALWFTHRRFHEGVRYYQELLLAMRGEDVHLRNTETGEPQLLSASHWRQKLFDYIEKARYANGAKGKLSSSELDKAEKFFKNFYQALMDQNHEDYEAEPKGKLAILTNSESKAGQGESDGGRPGRALMAMRKIFSERNDLAKKYGITNPSKIDKKQYASLITKLRKDHKNDLDLQDLLSKDETEIQKRREKQKKGKIIAELQEVGILRIIPAYIESISGKIIDGIAPFEYGMWGIAVATLRSWNTWNENTQKNREDLQKKLKDIETYIFDENKFPKKILEILQQYEVEQTEFYRKTQQLTKKAFRITRPMLRKWEELRNDWLKPQNGTEQKRIECISIWQRKNKSYGDVNLFRHLAKEQNTIVWRDSEKYLLQWARCNLYRDQLDLRPGYAHLSLSDAIYHPIWINNEFAESRGHVGSGSNKPGYFLSCREGKWVLECKLLAEANNGIEVIDAKAEILPSEQWMQFSNSRESGFHFTDSATLASFSATPKGAKLMYSRRQLEKMSRTKKDLANLNINEIPAAYFNCSWEIEPLQPDNVQRGFQKSGGSDGYYIGWFDNAKEARNVFKSSSSKGGVVENRNKKRQDIFRILAVDMGLRTFAACSIFSVRDLDIKVPDKKFHFAIKNLESHQNVYHAIHERSFLLPLPGEHVSRLMEVARRAYLGKKKSLGIDKEALEQAVTNGKIWIFPAWESAPTTRQMRQKINAMRILRRLQREKTSDDRKEALEDYIRRYQQAEFGWPFPHVNAEELRNRLSKFYSADEREWEKVLNAETELASQELKPLFTSWRKAFRKKRFIKIIHADRKKGEKQIKLGFAGNSIWNIEDLQETRKLMSAWHNRAERKGDQKNLEKYTHFATDLLEHIQNLKDNRVKEGAHALIMAALGYEYVAIDNSGAVLISDGSNKKAVAQKEIAELLKQGKRPKFWQTGLGNPAIHRGTWIKVYSPCDLIVFEDLSRFKFSSDRPRQENSMLMKWAHRAIPKETKMQGELYGLGVATVRAEFSSKFHARTLAPGIRGDFFRGVEIQTLKNELEFLSSKYESDDEIFLNASYQLRNFRRFFKSKELIKIFSARSEKTKEYLLPYDGGEYFVTLDANKNLVYLNADLNAAQSLARRFLTRYTEPVRIGGYWHKERSEFIVELRGSGNKNNRVANALGYGVLKFKAGSLEQGYFETEWVTKSETEWLKEYAKLLKKSDQKTDELSGSDQTQEETELETEEEKEKLDEKYIFFRDQSGILMDKNIWFSRKKFWTEVQEKIAKKFTIDDNLIMR